LLFQISHSTAEIEYLFPGILSNKGTRKEEMRNRNSIVENKYLTIKKNYIKYLLQTFTVHKLLFLIIKCSILFIEKGRGSHSPQLKIKQKKKKRNIEGTDFLSSFS
jgi:hypothetical protein